MLTAVDKRDGTDLVVSVLSPAGSTYTVLRWKATGAWSCNCLGWILHKAKLPAGSHFATAPLRNHCSHVLMAIRNGYELKSGARVRVPKKSGFYTLTPGYLPGYVQDEAAPKPAATREPSPRRRWPESPIAVNRPTGRAIARRGEDV